MNKQEAGSSVLARLQSWYLSHCDGDWQNDHGIGISNIDNPGWVFSVDLRGTELENAAFEEYHERFLAICFHAVVGRADRFPIVNDGAV